MILKDTYKTGGETKNKIMENKIKFSKEEQKDFNFWKQDGNVSKNEDGSYSTQDAQWTNRLKDLDALKEYYFKEFLNGSRYAGGGTTSKLKVFNVRDIKVGDKIYARWNDSMSWTIGIFKGETKNGFEVYDRTIERPEYIEFYAQISKSPPPYGDKKIFYSKNFKDRNYKNYHFIKEIQQGNYKKGGRTMQNIAKKQARKDIKTHLYKPQFPDVSSIKPSEKWARYELPYDTKLQYDFEPDSFSVQGKRYSEYADGGEIKVNGMTKEDYIDAFQNRVEKLIQELKEEGTYDENTFDFLYEIIEKGRDGGFTDIEETGFWLSDGDNRLAYYLSFDKNVGYRDYTDKVLSHFYFGKPMKIEFVLKTSGDTELAFEDELQKIKLLSNKIDFNKVVGVIDYEKTKNNTDLDFYKNIELVMSLNGDWDETTEELDTIIDVNGEMAYLNYHPLDSMGGVDMQQLKKNINEAFKELNTYSAVVSIEGYEEYAEDVEGLENAKSVIQNIKGNTRFQVLKGSSVGIGKRVDNSRVVEEYAKGGEAGFDDTGTSMAMYHEKKGNFMVAKGQVYLWFYDVENSAKKIESGEFDYVLYPFSSLSMMGQRGFIPPLKKIWTKKFQKQTKGSEHLLGVIKAFLIEEDGKKELYIDMMSVNPTKKKKGVMSYMIKDLRDTFDLTQEQITFSDLTDEGKKFLAKKTYDDGGGVSSNDEEKGQWFKDLIHTQYPFEPMIIVTPKYSLQSNNTNRLEYNELIEYLDNHGWMYEKNNWSLNDMELPIINIFINQRKEKSSTTLSDLKLWLSLKNWDYVNKYADGGGLKLKNNNIIWVKNVGEEGWSKDMAYKNAYENVGGYISTSGNWKIYRDGRFYYDKDMEGDNFKRDGDWIVRRNDELYGEFDSLLEAKKYVENWVRINPKDFADGGKIGKLKVLQKIVYESIKNKPSKSITTYNLPSDTRKILEELYYMDLLDRNYINGTQEAEYTLKYANGGDVKNKIQLKNFSDLKQGDVIRKKEKLGTTIFVVNKSPVQSRIYKNEYDVLVTCIVSNTNFYKPFEEYYITSVIKYGKLGNVDYLGKWNYDDKIDYSIYLPKSNKKYADGGEAGYELENYIISGKNFKNKYATDFNGEVAKVIYTKNLDLGSNLGKGSYWNVTQDSLDIYSGERDEELDSKYGQYFKNTIYKKIDDNLKIFVKDEIADELWDNEKLYNKIKNISDGIYDPSYDDYGLLLFENQYADGGEIYVHKYNPNITLEFIENTNKGIKGLQKNPKSLSKKERKEGIIVNYSDSEIKELFNKKFADGGDVPHEDKMFQLPLEMVIYVPSTQDVDKVISIDDMILRVDEVKKYLANKFGGYTSADKLGGFVDSTGNLVNEDVVQVTSFSTKEAYAENKQELINQLAKWCEEWGQESIGFEFEGDLMYVPNKFKKGGQTKNM